jgi:hypothetical protein
LFTVAVPRVLMTDCNMVPENTVLPENTVVRGAQCEHGAYDFMVLHDEHGAHDIMGLHGAVIVTPAHEHAPAAAPAQ